MAKKIGIAVGVLLVVAVAFVGTRPDRFRVARSAEISAPAGVVFALIDDFHQWGRWSPYDKLDPGVKRTFDGPAAGPGARYGWAGNNQVGEGRMTILESKPGELVSIQLDFLKPFACTNQARFTLEPAGAGTRVTWSMEGENSVLGKLMSAFVNMDEMIGRDFAQGLANLNAEAQIEARKLHEAAEAKAPVGGAPRSATP